MNAPNRTFGGRYVVIERAGSGGMAEVYRARDELLGREVAVKVLSERLSGDKTFVERFRREAQAAANLNHPNVVSLFDFGADGNTYYIVMEFIDGKPLADIITAEGPLMPERAAEIGIDVSRALERAHAAGLVHRDVKPSNIMLNSSGQTKVTDFGIARALSREGEQTVTQTGMVIGTAAYLSPEQAQGSPVDQRSDVYSLGCVLFEMLGGRPPFTGDTPLSVAYRHVRENPEPPSTVNPDVPKAMDSIVMKALAKNPDNRYQSATEIREDLERFLAGQQVHATPLLAPPPTSTQVIRGTEVAEYPPEAASRKGWLWAAALVLLLLGVLAYFLLSGKPTVEVPDLVGQTPQEAQTALEDVGLNAEFERRSSDDPKGLVFDQDPDAGESIEEGNTVTLFVSGGPKKFAVPDLTGLTKKTAKDELEPLDLELGVETKAFSETVEEGEIIDQDPAPGTRVEPGTTVDIIVSGGAEPVLVPQVVGTSQEDAESAITGLGLVVEVQEESSEDFAEGFVSDQDPEASTEVEPGSTVTITVSTGTEPFPLDDVTGDNADDAEVQLEDLGLVVSQSDEVCADPDIDPGEVCRTNPAAGTEVQAGDSVTIFVQAATTTSPST